MPTKDSEKKAKMTFIVGVMSSHVWHWC